MKAPVTVDAQIMGGTPCLAGTRVPVQTLLEYVDGPEGIAGFLANFPSVRPALAIEALRYAGRRSEADQLAKALLR